MEYKNILIIKMSSLGDILHALPFAAALRERYPQARISWLVHPQFAGFIPEAPWIDEVLYFDKAGFKKMNWQGKYAYAKQLRQELHSKKFDLVIDLQGLFKSGAVAYLTGCPTKIGYCEMREGSGLVSQAITGTHSKDHVIERYLDVARHLGAQVRGVDFPMPDLSKESALVSDKLAEGGLADLPYVVLVPGARWETKRWPLEHFGKLAELLSRDGYGVVLAGGPDDAPLGSDLEKILEPSCKVVNLIGRTSLRELAALIKDSCFFISGDTGPLHMASAYKKPLIAMYGPTKPERTGPYGNPAATVLVAQVPCAGCLKKHCGNWICMAGITPEQVEKVFSEKVGKNHGGAQ